MAADGVVDGAGGVRDADVDGGALGQVDGPGVRVAREVLGNGGQSGGRGLALGDRRPAWSVFGLYQKGSPGLTVRLPAARTARSG